ncbi:hypothetical protein ACIQVK_03910 [Streptomyces sp. NPDC090493]|uniref:hypothetical protein n=1 Tax=Streptomyces sp. NPDC090493 TaxID=3365964 RepID=UPI00382DF71C
MHTSHDHGEGAASASGEPPVDPVAEARRLVAEDQAARMRACAEEIQAVLAKYGMQLDVTPPQISIVPTV